MPAARNTFKQLIDTIEISHATLRKEYASMLKAQRRAKKHAWAIAVSYVELIGQHQSELLAYMKRIGMSGSNPIGEWLDMKLITVDALVLGGWRSVVKAVEGGMTEKQFLDSDAYDNLRNATKSSRKNKAAENIPEPTVPSETLPVEQQCQALRATCIEQRDIIRGLKESLRLARMEVREMRRIQAHDQKRIAILEQIAGKKAG